jgi:hypothetical protein
MLLKRDIVPALPKLGQVKGNPWFNQEFRRIGEEGARRYGILWFQVNIWIRNAVAGAGASTHNPVIHWLCFAIARGVCAGIQASKQEET